MKSLLYVFIDGTHIITIFRILPLNDEMRFIFIRSAVFVCKFLVIRSNEKTLRCDGEKPF